MKDRFIVKCLWGRSLIEQGRLILRLSILQSRIQDIIKEATSSVSMRDVLEKHKTPSTHTQSFKSNVDKAITMGKLEGAVEVLLLFVCSSDCFKLHYVLLLSYMCRLYGQLYRRLRKEEALKMHKLFVILMF